MIRVSVVVACVLLLGFLSVQGLALLHVFTGGAAKLMCSSIFAGNRAEDRVRRQEFVRLSSPGKYLALADLGVDHRDRSVVASVYGLGERRAIFRDGLGCTADEGVSVAELRGQGDGGVFQSPAPDPALLWPQGSATLAGRLPDAIDAGALQRALDGAFAEPDSGKPRNTRAVVIVYNGRIIAEQYADGFDRFSGHLSNSMAKTFTSALIGILVGDGVLDVRARAPIREWSDPTDPRSAITLEHLLRMQSGLEFEENYDRVRSDITMMYVGGDLAGFAAAKPLEAAPGMVWKYSTGTSNILGRIVSENSGATYPERFSYARRRLFEPLGMRHTVIEVDGRGNFVGGSSVFASAQDYARFGLLYLRDGVWEGRRILPEGWVEYTLTPIDNVPAGSSYGAQVWLNYNPATTELSWPTLPSDTFAMRGHQGQYVVVVPSRDLVVVRLGLTEFGNWDMESFVGDIVALLPHQAG